MGLVVRSTPFLGGITNIETQLQGNLGSHVLSISIKSFVFVQ